MWKSSRTFHISTPPVEVSGGFLKGAVDYCLCIPSRDTPRVQEAHIMAGHILCEIVEEEICGSGGVS